MKKETKNSKKISEKKIIAMILTAVILASISYLAVVQRIMQTQIDDLSTIKIGSLILEAVDGLNDPLPIDAKTGDNYIPEVRLRLPANSLPVNRLEYSHSEKFEDSPEEIRLSSVSAVNKSKVLIISAIDHEKQFEAVPRLQACTRGFRLTFEKNAKFDEGLSPVFEKTLKDGRQLYVQVEDACSDPEFFDFEYLKQIDSY